MLKEESYTLNKKMVHGHKHAETRLSQHTYDKTYKINVENYKCFFMQKHTN